MLSALDYWQLISGRCSRPRMKKRRWRPTNIPFPTVPLSLAVIYFIFLVSFVLVSSPETLVWLARRLG